MNNKEERILSYYLNVTIQRSHMQRSSFIAIILKFMHLSVSKFPLAELSLCVDMSFFTQIIKNKSNKNLAWFFITFSLGSIKIIFIYPNLRQFTDKERINMDSNSFIFLIDLFGFFQLKLKYSDDCWNKGFVLISCLFIFPYY